MKYEEFLRIREEGDLANASYWYSRAGSRMPKTTLEEEWIHISRYLLNE
ncbi:hypothetical protein ACFLTU_04455 [Bacteroidota bacterium]